jgi:gas vesicle protein
MMASKQNVHQTFIQGGITMAGAIVGLLLAPKPGEETRGALKGYARKAEEMNAASISSQRKQQRQR